jgi:predicted DNA-binding WGR domain protein
LNKGHIDRFWKADVRGETLTTTVGDFGGDAKTTTHTYPTPFDAYSALSNDQADKVTRGYLMISQEELDSLQKRAAHSETKPGTSVDAPPLQTRSPPKVIGSRKPPTPRGDTNPLASGGRAIMAVGQPWPICTFCDQPLALYLQFDVAEAHQLAFTPGSHLLLFYCLEDHPPPIFSGQRIPEDWLSPDHRSSYRIILNPPGVEEAIFEPDPAVLEQHLSFLAAKEKLVRGLDGPVGQPRVKRSAVFPVGFNRPGIPTAHAERRWGSSCKSRRTTRRAGSREADPDCRSVGSCLHTSSHAPPNRAHTQRR